MFFNSKLTNELINILLLIKYIIIILISLISKNCLVEFQIRTHNHYQHKLCVKTPNSSKFAQMNHYFPTEHKNTNQRRY